MEQEFNQLYNAINSANEKTRSFASKAMQDLAYLEENGVFEQFEKLQRPSERATFINTNDRFKSYLSNLSLMTNSLSESVSVANEMMKSSIGLESKSPSQPDITE
jgi:hypothetical protein